MGKPPAPRAPDPRVTAGAQTAQNIVTAITQQQLNNTNQVTPYGNLSYEQTGSYQYTDPNSNEVYDVPTYTATQTLSADQQAIHDQGQQAALNFATLAANQSGRLDDMLSNPMDLSGLPERGDVSAIQSPNFGLVGSGPQLQTNLGNAGDVQRDIQGAGPIQSNIQPGGRIRSQFADAGNVRRTIGNTGQITRTYGGDFSTERQRVEDTLMDRMNPGLERDRSALESRLASQGIRIGSEAYSAAMDNFGQQKNDARMSAILNAGQEQSRLTDMEAQRAGFENAAQQQAFNQQAQRAGFTNQAQAQQFAQNAQDAQFANQAQAQRFGQNAQRADFANQAQAQEFGQNAQSAGFSNSAQGQAFQQLMAQAGFGNQAEQQMHQNQTGATQANNQTALQGFNADMAQMNAQNATRNDALNEAFAVRNQPINEITALLSGAQMQSPNFVNTNPAQLANTDYAGITMAAHDADMQNYQAQMGAWNQFWGGLGGLGGAFLGAM